MEQLCARFSIADSQEGEELLFSEGVSKDARFWEVIAPYQGRENRNIDIVMHRIKI